MKRTLVDKIPALPEVFKNHIGNAKIYDSSCSPEARVYFIDKDSGYYLKTAAAGTLSREAELTKYFHKKCLGAEVLGYLSDENDWLLTAKMAGEDCTHEMYLSNPVRLCDLLAERLRELHELDGFDCPVLNRTDEYVARTLKNYQTGNYDKSHFPDSFGYRDAETAYAVFEEGKGALKNDTLLHGDYCLPNVMLENWRFSGFIDLDCGGVGDRHIDVFWGTWTLWFNLKTNKYRERFLDAYGRDKIDEDVLKVIAAAEVFG